MLEALLAVSLNLLDIITLTIRRTVPTMKFLIEEIFPLPIPILLGPNIRFKMLIQMRPTLI